MNFMTEKEEMRQMIQNYQSGIQTRSKISEGLKKLFFDTFNEQFAEETLVVMLSEPKPENKKITEVEKREHFAKLMMVDKIGYAVEQIGLAKVGQITDYLREIDSTINPDTIRTVIYKMKGKQVLFDKQTGVFKSNPEWNKVW